MEKLKGITAPRGLGLQAKKASVKPVRRRLLIPLIAVMFLLVGGFTVAWLHMRQESIDQSCHAKLEAVAYDLAGYLEVQSRKLSAVASVLLHDAILTDALKAQDRDRLLATCETVFLQMRAEHGITHFYFHRPDRVNLLRVHKPQMSGDLIDRFTTLEAERTGKTASGIELGPLGTFTLRVVRPVFDSATLIGYLELGQEIEDILTAIHTEHGVELAATIHKRMLDRAQWEAGRVMFGRESNWDRFPDDVLIFSSMPQFPSEYERYVGETAHVHRELTTETAFSGKTWRVKLHPLMDASGAHVGDLIVIHDISRMNAAFYRVVLVTSGAALVLLAVLFIFLYILLRRTDQGILKQQEDLQESEAFERTLSESSPDFILVLDTDGTIQRVNRVQPGYCEEDVVGQRASIFALPEYRDAFEGAFRKAVDTGQLQTVETEVDLPDGRQCCLNRLNPISHAGRKDLVILIITDITERKRAEEDRKRLEKNLFQSDKMASIGQLAAGVAHEINNPMGFISSNLNTMNKYLGKLIKHVTGDDSKSPENREQIKEMIEDFGDAISESLEGADRVKKIVADLKSFSRVDAGNVEYANLNEGLETTLNIVWNQIKYNCKVEKEFGHIPQIECFPNKINQVFMNLLVNAGQATKGESGLIRIKTWADDDHVHVSISDNGCGIPKENLPKLFDAFFTTKEVGKGTGLGLHLAYDIVKKHGGTITVDTEVGKGTEFIISLPIIGKHESALTPIV